MLLLVAVFIQGLHVNKHDHWDSIRSSELCSDA